jgi:hypothetical protein
MKTLFTKYNRDRLPQFQILTKIVEENGIRKATKQSVSNVAQSHISRIYNNYRLLMDNYSQMKLCKPTLCDDGIEFEMARGDSFEILLKRELDSQNKEGFFILIEKYIKYLDSFVANFNVEFRPCNQFIEVFGEWTIDQSQDIIDIANVDLTFNNIFIFEDEITYIDYEWIFTFPCPKSFILWRAIFQFFMFYGAQYSKLISANEVLLKLGIDLSHNEAFLQLEKTFQHMVFGKEFKFLLNFNVLQSKVDLFEQLCYKNQELTAKNQEIAIMSQELVEKNHEIQLRCNVYNGLMNSLRNKMIKPFRFSMRKIKKIIYSIKW